jgi:hypothetical protein
MRYIWPIFKIKMMKRILLSISLMLAGVSMGLAQTEGVLTVTASTGAAGGNYAPRNCVVVWIEDEQGNFVKTLMAYAANRKTHLNTWEASTTAAGSAFNVVDAITGATRNSHDTRVSTWNGTDVNGNIVPDGVYKVRMELTDKNSTGNFSTFQFTKDTIPVNLTPQNVPSFSNISIVWDPVITTGVKDGGLAELFSVYPNPTTGKVKITGSDFSLVEVLNETGTVLQNTTSASLDLSSLAAGVYYLRIQTESGIAVKKILLKPSVM